MRVLYRMSLGFFSVDLTLIKNCVKQRFWIFSYVYCSQLRRRRLLVMVIGRFRSDLFRRRPTTKKKNLKHQKKHDFYFFIYLMIYKNDVYILRHCVIRRHRRLLQLPVGVKQRASRDAQRGLSGPHPPSSNGHSRTF